MSSTSASSTSPKHEVGSNSHHDLTVTNIAINENNAAVNNNTNSDDDEEGGLFLSETALIALISSLGVMLFLVILLLSVSICLKMYRKKEDAK